MGRRVEVVDWPSLFSRKENWEKRIVEIEPGELEQLHYTILISSAVQTVHLESYFRNTTKRRRQLGWRLETFQDVLPGSRTENHTIQMDGYSVGPQKEEGKR